VNSLPPRPAIRKLFAALVIVTVFLAGNFTGYMAKSARANTVAPSEFGLFWEAWELVELYFVDRNELDLTAMTYGAIRGMLDSLGDENHTVFFTPDEAKQQASSLEGSFEGIGAYVGMEDGYFTILSPIHGSPAEAAGLLAGDIVLSVDSEEIVGRPDWEVISLIRGPAGSTVTLTVQRVDVAEPFEVEVKRDRIDIDSVLWSPIPETDLAYLQITQFANDTGLELERALLEISEASNEGKPIAGIVLDLRNNPGGYLHEAIRVGSQFLEEDEVILHARDANDEIMTYRAYGKFALARDLPMVVLINEGSASAAEIVAGALQSHERAPLIGEVTLGTGTVLRPYTLSDGSVVRLGVTNWLTPDFELIKNEGVMPDLAVEQAASVEMIDSIMLESLEGAELETHEDRQFGSALLMLQMSLMDGEIDAFTALPAETTP
jgi:carboxyl-terminal processing protease